MCSSPKGLSSYMEKLRSNIPSPKISSPHISSPKISSPNISSNTPAKTSQIFKIYVTKSLDEMPVVGFGWKYNRTRMTNELLKNLNKYVVERCPELKNQNLKFYYKGGFASFIVTSSQTFFYTQRISIADTDVADFYLSIFCDVDMEILIEQKNTNKIFVVTDAVKSQRTKQKTKQ